MRGQTEAQPNQVGTEAARTGRAWRARDATRALNSLLHDTEARWIPVDWGPLRGPAMWALRVVAFLAAVMLLIVLGVAVRVLLIALGAPWPILDENTDRWSEIRNGLFVVGVALGAPFVVWRTMLASRQTDIQQQTHYMELYAKAVEFLGSTTTDDRGKRPLTVPNIETRVGSIYALERIARQSKDDYRPIYALLCAYACEHDAAWLRPWEAGIKSIPDAPASGTDYIANRCAIKTEIDARKNNVERWVENLRRAEPSRVEASAARRDVRAALDAIGRRPADPHSNGAGAHVVPPQLPERGPEEDAFPKERIDAFMSEIAAWRDAIEAWRDSCDWRPDLGGVVLQGVTHAGVNLRRVDLTRAKLDGAKLVGARLEGAILVIARLFGAKLNHAYLSGADCRGAHFFAARLNEACLAGARLDPAILQAADLRMANLEGAKLCGARLEWADLGRAQLEGADFSGAHLGDARLSGAYLANADLHGALMPYAQLSLTDLRRADLSEAAMQSAVVGGAKFDGATVAGADLSTAEKLVYKQMEKAFGDGATTLPPDLEDQRFRLVREAGWVTEDLDSYKKRASAWARWRRDRETQALGSR